MVCDKSVFSGSHIKFQMVLIVLQYGWSQWKYRLKVVRALRSLPNWFFGSWIGSFFKSTNKIPRLVSIRNLKIGALFSNGRYHHDIRFGSLNKFLGLSFSIPSFVWFVSL